MEQYARSAELMRFISLEDCQAKKAATPMQNVIRNTIAREVRLSSNGHLIENHSFFGSVGTFGSAGTRVASTDDLVASAQNHYRVKLSVDLIAAFRLSLICPL